MAGGRTMSLMTTALSSRRCVLSTLVLVSLVSPEFFGCTGNVGGISLDGSFGDGVRGDGAFRDARWRDEATRHEGAPTGDLNLRDGEIAHDKGLTTKDGNIAHDKGLTTKDGNIPHDKGVTPDATAKKRRATARTITAMASSTRG